MSELSLYLSRLKFEPKLLNWPIAKYYANIRVIILIMLSLALAGVVSFLQLPRELNPEIDLAIVSVVTTLPGASPLDVEELISQPIEKELTNLADVDVMSSSSNQSVSVITIQFLGSVEPELALAQVKERVDSVTDLPDDASDPVVEKLDFNDQPIWSFALTGYDDRRTLTQVAKEFRDNLENESGIREVSLSGIETEQVIIELNTQALQTYQVTPDQVAQLIRSNDLSFPAGTVTTSGLEYTLSVDQNLDRVEEVRNLYLSINGSSVRLSELANIYIQSPELSNPTYLIRDGERLPVVQVSVFKTSNATITEASAKTQTIRDQTQTKYPQLSTIEILNFAEDTDEQFQDLQGNFLSSVALIFLVLSIFLGVRQAMIAAISLPLTLMATFLIMGLSGITLNFLSLFSLLLALSLVGDDAIVITQSSRQYQKKFPPFQAGLLVFRDFFIPIWTGTLTVVWSFVPLLLASGIIGKFIRPIPIVVSATLLSSTAIATMINLPLNIVLAELKIPSRVRIVFTLLMTVAIGAVLAAASSGSPLLIGAIGIYLVLLLVIFLQRKTLGKRVTALVSRQTKRPILSKVLNFFAKRQLLSKPWIDLTPITNGYKHYAHRVLSSGRWRRVVYATVIGLIVVSGIFLGTGMLKNEFFPATEQDILYLSVEGAAGWPQEKTLAVAQEIQPLFADIPDIEHILLQVGSTANLGFGNTSGGNHTANFTIRLKPENQRQSDSIKISEDLRQRVSSITAAKVTVDEVSSGPPAGAAFQANIQGDDLETLEKISQDFQDMLSEIEGVINIGNSLQQTPGQITVRLIPAELAAHNLSAAQVGSWLRTVVSGQDQGTITIAGDDANILVTVEDTQQQLSNIQNLPLPSQFGPYTLGDIAEFTLEQSPLSITRQDNQRVVRVTAGVRGTTAPTVLKEFQAKVAEYDLPDGYTWNVGGENEENIESVQSILRAMGVSFILILVTMVLSLGSFRKALIVLSVIPLAVCGVFINFTFFGIPLSFPALIGVLALFGIVVNNAIMLIDKISQNVREGFDLYEGVADACASRIEPIFLTTVTGIVGLLPITISDPLWRGLGGAIVAGLAFSGLIILLYVPAIFIEVFGGELKHLKKGKA